MLEWLKDLLTIYTWKEFWTLMTVPTSIVGIWFLFCYLLAIPNDIIRTIAIWSLIFALTWGAATVESLKKQRSKV